MSHDLTVIYLTANKHPERFAAYQQKVLAEAISDYPLVSVSRQPMDGFGENIVDTGEHSHINMYRQLVNACKIATTPYIAVAEDDVLYSREHFTFYRPKMDTFAYDMSRWSLFTWSPMFSIKRRVSNCMLIAPREAYIAAWEERFAVYPGNTMPPHFVSEIGRHMYEKQMGVKLQKTVEVYASVPSVHINHPNGLDSTGLRKKHGEMRALEIPHWGRAEDLAQLYA